MQKITPFLWFDTEAEEAMNFYLSVFKNAKAKGLSHYGEGSPGPKGSVMTATFEIEGVELTALNGGPIQDGFTPSISFFVNCETAEEVDALWARLSEGGTPLMEVGEYPFSKRYGWIKDKFDVSWQLMIGTQSQPGRKIVPCLLFTDAKYGWAESAINHYTSIFPDSSVTFVHKAGPGGPDKEGAVQFSTFKLFGETFSAMDGSGTHNFSFTMALSFMVSCDSQEEVDKYWDALTADGGKEVQCGWLTDKFGVSWQIVPKVLMKLINDPDPAKAKRAMQAMLQMKKIDIAGLQKAYDAQ